MAFFYKLSGDHLQWKMVAAVFALLLQRRNAMQDWIGMELETSEIGDARLDARYKIIMNDLSQKPSFSIPTACNSWKDTFAAYRFFANERTDEKSILEPHQDATLKRIQEQKVVLTAQDTTEIDVTRRHEKMAGAGPLSEANRLGFFNHTMLAITSDRIPLGVVHAQIYARDMEEFLTNQKDKKNRDKKRKLKPIEEKESYRWLIGYQKACEIQSQCPETQIVIISDSEGDIYECFSEGALSENNECKADWIIRACQDRSVQGERIGYTYPKLWQEAAKAEIMGQLEIKVTGNEPKSKDSRKRRQKKTGRTAIVTVQAKELEIRAPYRKGQKLSNVKVNAVYVSEINPPDDEPPVEWLLLTRLPIKSFEVACLVIEYYCCRWQIEIYFRILKSGCKVEELQSESAERFIPCLAMYMIIAWRVMFLLMLGRECPDMPCDAVFSEDEWQSVYVIVKKKKPPEDVPRLEEMVKIIAGLGGYLGRKHDGPPGPKAMWIGLQRMADYAMAWRTFKSVKKPDG